MLIGLQRTLLLELNAQSERNSHISTGPVHIEKLANQFKITAGTCRTSINRLVEKGFLERDLSKPGKNGFSVFKIIHSVRRQIKKDQITESSQKSYPQDPRDPNNIYNNNIITIDSDIPSRKEEDVDNFLISNIDIEPLEDFGFKERHLNQIKKDSGLTDEMIQESIYAYAFDLKENEKDKKIKGGDPLKYFMGILLKGRTYNPPSNYESPQLRSVRLCKERMDHERRKIEKFENEIQAAKFEEWLGGVGEEEIEKAIPEKRYREERDSTIFKSFMKDHFKQKHWPIMKKTLGI